MIINNYLQEEGYIENDHDGRGKVKNVKVFAEDDFDINLNF